MQFNLKIRCGGKKTAIVGLLAVLLMFFGTMNARAGWFTDVTAGSFFGWIAGGVGYLIGLIAGVAFWIVGLVVTLALNFNLHITEPGNLIVQSGWSIILNITNLGFVLAIIVIAFATVLRFENYAIKKTLWKLIVAALLVNFSLTISNAFINTANDATKFMMDKSGVNTPLAWASAMGGMFQVQKLLEVDKNFDNKMKGIAEGTLSTFLTVAASLVFGAVFTFIASITLLTVGILLFVRYVVLSFLLMFSPIIWLAWIFPATKTYWEMWWKKFLKWTFFAPVMMFFMYLALRTMNGTVAAYGQVPSNFTSNAPITVPMAVIGQMFLVIGLIMGGMYVANAIGIEFADKIYDATSKYGKGWAYRGGQRFMGSRPITGTQKFLNNTLGGIPVLRAIPRGFNRLGVTTEQGAVGAMGDYRSYVKGLKDERLNNELTTQSGRKLNIAIEEAAKAGSLNPGWDIVKNTLMDPDKLEAMEKSFAAQKLNIKDVTKVLGVNSKILKSAKEGDSDALVREQKDFFEKMSPNDFAKNKLVGELYKEKPSFAATLTEGGVGSLQKAFADAMVKANRVGGMYKLFPSMSADQINRFDENISETISKLEKSDKKEDRDKAESVKKSKDKAISKRLYGEPPEEEKEEKKKDEGGTKKEGEKK